MANTYTQILIHVVFAVKYRERLITPPHREEIQKDLTGIVENHGHKMLAVFCMPDHAHMLVGLKPFEALSDLMREVKACSSAWVNERGWCRGKFQWQGGFGAFSCDLDRMHRVVKYILNQEEHHRERRFNEEYIAMLNESEVAFDTRYIFRWDDNSGSD